MYPQGKRRRGHELHGVTYVRRGRVEPTIAAKALQVPSPEDRHADASRRAASAANATNAVTTHVDRRMAALRHLLRVPLQQALLRSKNGPPGRGLDALLRRPRERPGAVVCRQSKPRSTPSYPDALACEGKR